MMELPLVAPEVLPMVMRNRHDGTNTPQWWDDLPPEIKKRCANAHSLGNDSSESESDPDGPFDDPSPKPLKVTRDLSWLAIIFVIIAAANLLFLLGAMRFLNGRGMFGG